MRTVVKMLLEMERTRTETSSFDLRGVIKVGEIVLQRQSLSLSSGGLRSVLDNDLFIPHLHPNLRIYQGYRDSDDLRPVNGKDREGRRFRSTRQYEDL
jgi:hypothetical protein